MNTTTIDRELTNRSTECRLHNIRCLSELDRRGLMYGVRERRLLIYITASGERIYIQYPGKESAREKNVKPWDFRPKLVKSDGSQMKDLSFKDIWDDLFDVYAQIGHNEELFCKIAAVFCRMAYFADHVLAEGNFHFYDYDLTDDMRMLSDGEVGLSLYILNPQFYLNELTAVIPQINGVSLEGYLIYNDLLAQNEDCKYYYRDVYEKGKSWNGKIGGFNTLLSYLSVIQFIQDKIGFTEIVDKFMRGYGVAPINLKDIEAVTNGLCYKC